MARRIFVGNLPPDVKRSEVEHLMDRYGKVTYVDLKATRPTSGPPFAFVEFEDSRDAEDAVAARNGQNFRGCQIRVEFCRGKRDRVGEERRSPPGLGIGRAPPSRRSHFRVRVTGLPLTVSWQDLKDHFRMAGDVCFAETNRDGTRVVEFPFYEDMKKAVRKLDDTKIQSHEGHTGYIRVEEESPSGGRGRSRSRSRSRRRT